MSRTLIVGLSFVFLAARTDSADQPNPAWYVRQATWQETLLKSRAELLRREGDARGHSSLRPYASPVVRSGDPAVAIRVPVAGVQDLYLLVTGAPYVVRGAATWADARLIASDGTSVWACHLPGLTFLEGQHTVDVNLKSGVSGPLSIAGRRFEHGIHVYADSKVRLPLKGHYQFFEARIGIDDWTVSDLIPSPAATADGSAAAGDSAEWLRRGAVRFDVTDTAGAARFDLWKLVADDFADPTARQQMRWEREDRILDADWSPADYGELARRYAAACRRTTAVARQAETRAGAVRDASGLDRVRSLYYRSRTLDEALSRSGALNFRALRRAVADLHETFGPRYRQGPAFLKRIDDVEGALRSALATVKAGDPAGLERVAGLVSQFDAVQSEALSANPLLDFERLLVVRRKPDGDPRRQDGTGYGLGEYLGLPRQSSKCNPGIERPFDWDNEIAVLEPVRPSGRLTTLFAPDRPADVSASGGRQPTGGTATSRRHRLADAGPLAREARGRSQPADDQGADAPRSPTDGRAPVRRRLITDVDLHWNADRLLFSMPGSHDKWQVFELRLDGGPPRQLTPSDQPDVHAYDACYLPNGRINFISTAPLQGVPCNAGVIVGMLYQMDGDGRNVRQVCFEQDHDYCPTVLNSGRVLYLRWDYTDTPHVWNRQLFSMNPDGTDQMEYYGSNSYWPNAIFYARPIPDHPTKVVGIVTGHHVGRVGELIIFDPEQGRRETDGVVQRIPGTGQRVAPLIEDKLTQHSWPKFLHPFPLSEKYFLVSAKPTPESLWGIYVADVFDNLVLVKEVEGQALLEPIPLRRTPRPPVIPDRTDPERTDAQVYIADVYAGPGLEGIPRGTIHSLRVFSYHFGYQRIAGIDHRVGTDGPWEVKRILGTVPIEADGSALFHVPAKTPLSVQALDAEGQAVQLMRSWMTAQPGETLSCVGCHDNRNTSPPSRATLAARRPAREIAPWYGPARNFSFRHEVQPVLDRYCTGCHNGGPRPDGRGIADLRGEQGASWCYRGGDPRLQLIRHASAQEVLGRYGGIFSPSYVAMRSLVRAPGLESDLRLLPATEFHAATNELVQMLRKGHHGVQLDRAAWDRLITWIDLNAPEHGRWSDFVPIAGGQRQRRCELRQLYGGLPEDGEELPEPPREAIAPVLPPPPPPRSVIPVSLSGWPVEAAVARRRQAAAGPVTQTVDRGGVAIELVRIPAGRFVMGREDGPADEQPPSVVTIERPFWMSRCEVTNAQFARFQPHHASRYEHRGSWIFGEEYLGWPLDQPQQPVVRVSWYQAAAFCRWLSQRTGRAFTLPTEAQWEYACRAGTATPFSFGPAEADFSPFANLADASIRDLAYKSWSPRTPDIVPRDDRFNDQALVSAVVGSYRPNAWGLCDMHGNVAEWTRSVLRSYPYRDDDVRNEEVSGGPRVVRGGSWRDRPARCTSSFRLHYAPYHRVFNVGFRVVCAAE